MVTKCQDPTPLVIGFHILNTTHTLPSICAKKVSEPESASDISMKFFDTWQCCSLHHSLCDGFWLSHSVVTPGRTGHLTLFIHRVRCSSELPGFSNRNGATVQPALEEMQAQLFSSGAAQRQRTSTNVPVELMDCFSPAWPLSLPSQPSTYTSSSRSLFHPVPPFLLSHSKHPHSLFPSHLRRIPLVSGPEGETAAKPPGIKLNAHCTHIWAGHCQD